MLDNIHKWFLLQHRGVRIYLSVQETRGIAVALENPTFHDIYNILGINAILLCKSGSVLELFKLWHAPFKLGILHIPVLQGFPGFLKQRIVIVGPLLLLGCLFVGSFDHCHYAVSFHQSHLQFLPTLLPSLPFYITILFFDKCNITIKAGNFVCQPYILHLENRYSWLHIIVLNHDTKVRIFLELHKYFKLNNVYNMLIINVLC